MLKKLPVGIQTFRNIIEDNYLYIDKTQLAYNLIDEYKYVFHYRVNWINGYFFCF